MQNINMTASKDQIGFTTIECIIIVILLSFLAVIAYPTIVNLRKQAQIETNQGFAKKLSAAISQSHELWLARKNPSTVTLKNGTVVNMNLFGWPNGIGELEQGTDEVCANIWNILMQNSVKALAGAKGCAENTACYNAIYAIGPPEICTYRDNGFPNIGVVYIIKGGMAEGTVTAFTE